MTQSFSLLIISLSFYSDSWRCEWPEPEGAASMSDDIHMLLIADPQITDKSSYGQNPGLLLTLTEHYSDTYMTRAFQTLLQTHEPHRVLFLGDMTDGAWSLRDTMEDDRHFEHLMRRFKDIFWHKAGARKDDDFFMYVPGNHDVPICPACGGRRAVEVLYNENKKHYMWSPRRELALTIWGTMDTKRHTWKVPPHKLANV